MLLRFANALQSDDDSAVVGAEGSRTRPPSEIDFGNANVGEKTEIKVRSELSYYKLSIDGSKVLEIDLVNMTE